MVIVALTEWLSDLWSPTCGHTLPKLSHSSVLTAKEGHLLSWVNKFVQVTLLHLRPLAGILLLLLQQSSWIQCRIFRVNRIDNMNSIVTCMNNKYHTPHIPGYDLMNTCSKPGFIWGRVTWKYCLPPFEQFTKMKHWHVNEVWDLQALSEGTLLWCLPLHPFC